MELFLALKLLLEQLIETFANSCKMEEAEALDRFGEKDNRALMAYSLYWPHEPISRVVYVISTPLILSQ